MNRGRERTLFIDARTVRSRATGVGSYTAELLCALDVLAPAYGLRLVALRFRGENHAAWDRLRMTEIIETDVDYEAHPRGDLFVQWELPRLALRYGADVLISPAFLAPVMTSRGRSPLRRVVIVHDLLADDPEIAMSRAFRWYLRTMVTAGCARCEVIATPSAVTRRPLRKRSGQPVLFVPPAVDHALFYPRSRISTLPDGSQRTRPVVIYAASFEPRKNHTLLLRAVQGMNCDVVLLHGATWNRSLPDNVRVVMPRTPADIAEWTAAADIVAFPSRAEGFGIPMLEALACGTPLVAADTAAARWLTGNGRAARLLPADDPSIWSAAIQALIDGTDQGCDTRVAAGIRRAAGFRWERSAERLLHALFGPTVGGV